MKKVPPYYSVNGIAYHIYDDCHKVNDIEPKYLRQGTGRKKMCDYCESFSKRKK